MKTASMNKINLLLVEDNDDDRFLTMRILNKLPLTLHVDVAKNGDEALQLLLDDKSPPPALVLLDLQLPKIGGTILLAKVRERFKPTDLPVIILSSSDNPIDIKLCRDLGISGYLSKPLDTAAILAVLHVIFPDLHGTFSSR